MAIFIDPLCFLRGHRCRFGGTRRVGGRNNIVLL
jgi:hypothetical protein